MEDKIQEPQKIDRLDLDKYGLSYLRGRNILDLTSSDIDELLKALANDDISINLPLPFTPYNVEGVLSYSECRRCGKCCLPDPLNPGSPGVEVLEDELKLIARHLHSPYETLEKKTAEGKELSSPSRLERVAITRRLPLPCPFYSEKTNDCQVHSVRPVVCTIYPIIFGENKRCIEIKVNCDYGKDIAVSAIRYLRTNNPELVLKL